MICETTSAEGTQAWGKRWGQRLRKGDVLCLYGDLGSGKTTFVRGLAVGVGASPDEVSSPTFVLMNIYQGRKVLYHCDFYRCERPEDVRDLGLEEFIHEGIVAVEWPEKARPFLPETSFEVHFRFVSPLKRRLTFRAAGSSAQERLTQWFKKWRQKLPG